MRNSEGKWKRVSIIETSKEKGEIKTKKIRKFKSKDHMKKSERCKTKRKSPHYVSQNLAEHSDVLNINFC